ncbi:pentapeptide repeat protein [Edaphobacter aggregans]|uniref:Pentapeptide repeat protein n=2 Tax=Edaphobacter aggregans TaxID=570835 RepID=A0A3R9WHT5_9BACT|nr:pentapeptide repeat protein [Edaphobacter aggregans]
MHERKRRSRPKPWTEHCLEVRGPRWMMLFHRLEWWFSWMAWALGNWAFLDVLEHLGTFSVLIAVIFYFADSGNRRKQKHYQAWQVINTAQGKGGSGGRIEALQELNADRVSLIGIEASGAFLQGLSLRGADLSRCDFHASDLRNSDFANSRLNFCGLKDANFRSANLTGAAMEDVDMGGADLSGANMGGADLSRADLSRADLRNADLKNIVWKEIGSMRLANVAGVRNASPEFMKFAAKEGAVILDSDEEWDTLLRKEQ